MSLRTTTLAALLSIPSLAAAQASPVADALRAESKRQGKNLVAAAEEMPADKYSYAPTKAQMSFGAIQAHLVEGNDGLCSALTGVKAPVRAKLNEATSTKEQYIAQLKDSFKFCDDALVKLDDSKLSEKLDVYGMTMSRAGVVLMTAGDWADHYSQESNYLRLNGKLPPTAKKPPM